MSVTVEEVGHAGHFICAQYCRYTRHTQVTLGDKGYRVSTVGEMYWEPDTVKAMEGVKKDLSERLGVDTYEKDPSSPWFCPAPDAMQTLGFGSDDGGPPYYEVAVFPTSGQKESTDDCPCRVVTSWSEEEMFRFSTKEKASLCHIALVEKYKEKLEADV